MEKDKRISEIFYYFEKHTTVVSGRKTGRKIGVVQEIICKKLLLTSDKVRDSIIYEPKLLGRSGATHKVEFVLLQPLLAANVSVGKQVQLAPGLDIVVDSIDALTFKAKVKITTTTGKAKATIKAGAILKCDKHIAGSRLLIKIVAVGISKVRFSVLDQDAPVASIESKRVGAQRFANSKKLGSGIQTIEKAKQASLVAIDFDLKFNGALLTQTAAARSRNFKSFVVLGNGVHWTKHDLAILETYVDYTFLANDAAIIRYADFVRDLARKAKKDFFPFFMAYFNGMTKTPPDAFVVTDGDFTPMCPIGAGSFLKAVESQIKYYTVQST